MTKKQNITIARVYGENTNKNGVHLLVDRLWPRGIAKKDLEYDDWIKEIAPSDDLREWYGHDVDKWNEFQKRYRAELEENQDAVERCLDWVKKKQVTLLYGAKDEDHNNAVVLRDYLEEKIEN